MKVLIAGCGYVGQRLAEALAGETEVLAVRRAPQPDAPKGVRWLAADLVRGDLAALPGGLDAVVVAAAPGASTPDAYADVYERMLARVIDHAAATASRMPRIVLTSSTSVYPQGDGQWVDEDTPAEPEAATSRWIRAGERRVADAGGVAVRLGGIYGPGRTSFLESIRRGEITVNARASAFTNRIHRDDAAGILRHVLKLPAPLPVYNGVDSDPATRADVARWIAGRLGVPLRETDGAEESSILRGNKRVSNARLRASGYDFVFPSYREGYGELIGRA